MTDDGSKVAASSSTVDTKETKQATASTVEAAKKAKKNRGPPPGIQPKPKLTKAERRALQEKQRAEKAAKQQGKAVGGDAKQQSQTKQQQQQPQQPQRPPKQAQESKIEGRVKDTTKTVLQDNSLSLFSHLPQPRELPNPYAPEWTNTLHPDVIDLGMKYASGEISEDNARCRSMMHCFLQVLQDYQLPDISSATKTASATGTIDFRTHFDHHVLKPSFQFWTVECRPHSVSMGNAFTFLKTAVASLERDLPLEDAKVILQETMERYLVERLKYAGKAISQHAKGKLQRGDVVLTFGYSEVVEVLLTTAKEEKIDFYVWVADSRPLADGKELLKSLKDAGIKCGYVELNALTYVMQQVSKVFLGASALMSNGSVYGRIGTAAVAVLAKDRHVPVLVCCESYKISNKVQLESITQNELGNPEAILPAGKSNPRYKVLNLMFDVTPSEFVSGIVTELGIIPPTSVAVLLSEMNPQDAAYM